MSSVSKARLPNASRPEAQARLPCSTSGILGISGTMTATARHYVYVAQFDCNGVNRELFQNMRHVNGQTMCGISMWVSWLMLRSGTCRPVKHMSLGRSSGGWAQSPPAVYTVYRAWSGCSVLSLYFDTERRPPFLRSHALSIPASQPARPLRPRGPEPCGFHIIRIDHSTIDSFVMISICRKPRQTIPPGLFRETPSSPHFRCDATATSELCSGSSAFNSPACLSQYYYSRE